MLKTTLTMLVCSLVIPICYAQDKTHSKYDMNYDLVDQVRDNNLERVQALIEKGANPNIEFNCGFALTQAVIKGNKSILKFLLAHGAKKELLDPYSQEQVDYMLHGNVNIDLTNAVFMSDFEKAQSLITNGADPNTSTTVGLPLDAAILSSNKKAAEFLLKNGAKRELLSNDNQFQLSKLIASKEVTQNDIALSERISQNDHCSVDAIKTLIEQGADPNVEYRGWSAFSAAVTALNKPLVEFLLKNGAKNELLSTYGQRTVDYILTGNKDGMLKAIGRHRVSALERKRTSDTFLASLPTEVRKVIAKRVPDFVVWAKDDYIVNSGSSPFYTTGDYNSDAINDVALCGNNGKEDLLIVVLSSNHKEFQVFIPSNNPLVDPCDQCQTFKQLSSHDFYPEFGLVSNICTFAPDKSDMDGRSPEMNSRGNHPFIRMMTGDITYIDFLWKDGNFIIEKGYYD